MSAPALVLIDLQKATDDPKWGPRNNPNAEAEVARLLEVWRSADAPVFHVRHDSLDPASPYRPGQPGNEFIARALPRDGEQVIVKQTNSAFVGTQFETILRNAGHDQLVLAGVLTNHCVESTARHGGNLGFDVFVVADACWAVDKRDHAGHLWRAAEVHALSLANLEGEFARVCDSAAALRFLADGKRPDAISQN